MDTNIDPTTKPKNKVLIVISLLLILLICCFVCGLLAIVMYARNNYKFLGGLPQDIACHYDGKLYFDGDSFEDKDGCNTCTCFEGNVTCTLMYCEVDEPTVINTIKPTKTTFPTEVFAPLETGTITGTISGPPTDFPADHQMIVCAESPYTGAIIECTEEITVSPQNYTPNYSLDVMSGVFYVYAYDVTDPTFKIYYDEMVRCGFSVECATDIIPVVVMAGETVTNINPQDWYTVR